MPTEDYSLISYNWDKLYLSELITDGQNCGYNELNFDWHNQATNQLIWGLIKGLSRRDNKKRDHARFQLQLNLLHFHGGLAVEVYFPHLRIPSLALACPLLTSTSSTGTLHFLLIYYSYNWCVYCNISFANCMLFISN